MILRDIDIFCNPLLRAAYETGQDSARRGELIVFAIPGVEYQAAFDIGYEDAKKKRRNEILFNPDKD